MDKSTDRFLALFEHGHNAVGADLINLMQLTRDSEGEVPTARGTASEKGVQIAATSLLAKHKDPETVGKEFHAFFHPRLSLSPGSNPPRVRTSEGPKTFQELGQLVQSILT